MIEKAKSKKILLIALESINNIGEELLRASTEYLVKSVLPDVTILAAQLKPGRVQIPSQYKFLYFAGAFVLRISLFLKGNISYRVRNLSYLLKYTLYFSSVIRQCDKIILPIGMIKYGTQDFSYVFHIICKVASKYNKPILMSAMSPQIADGKDWRYHQLVQAVNMPAVKMITTRDGQVGVQILKSDYIRKEIQCDYVGDPALWIPEAYGVKREKKCDEHPFVGINIIRRGIFDDYNQALTDKELFNIYIQLIRLLDEKGWQWIVFTNGMASDEDVLWDLQSEIGFSKEHIAPPPVNGQKYAEMIAGFDVVFGARLHSCITSVAVGTPVVSFIWENKMKYFSEVMKISKYFFNPQEMSAEEIFKKLSEVVVSQLDANNREMLKLKTIESIKAFLKNC